MGDRHALHRSHTVAALFEGVNTTTGFMLVDLSDTTNWPHTNTNHVVVDGLYESVDPDSSFTGDIYYGWLSAAGTTSSTLNCIRVISLDHNNRGADTACAFYPDSIECKSGDWFGLSKTSQTKFQTDTNLKGPDGNTSYPAGNGDFVALVDRSAGTLDMGLVIKYHTE